MNKYNLFYSQGMPGMPGSAGLHGQKVNIHQLLNENKLLLLILDPFWYLWFRGMWVHLDQRESKAQLDHLCVNSLLIFFNPFELWSV